MQILATASRIDSWFSESAKSTTSLLLSRCRDGHAVTDHRSDLGRRKAGLAQDGLAMLVEAWRQSLRLGFAIGPGRGHAHAADRPFGRMLDHGKEIGRNQMRIFEHA